MPEGDAVADKAAKAQRDLELPPRREDSDASEIEQEERAYRRVLRALEDAVEEIGRQRVCYVLKYTEPLLSKQLSGYEGKEPKARLLAFCVKHQKSERLARVLMEYAEFLPPHRPELLESGEAMREVMALALAGELGNAGRDKVRAIYERMRKRGAS